MATKGKPKTEKVGVIGAGSWGTAVANLFADAGSAVTLWGRDEALVRTINERHQNEKYLKGLPLSSTLKADSDLEKVISKSSVVVCSIPTQQIRNVFQPFGKILAKKLIVNTSKGIEMKTLLRVSEIFSEISPKAKYAILSGPSFVEEVVKRLPTAVTLASKQKATATKIQKMLLTPYFRAYTSEDVVGVEYAGALKNVVAIASGVVMGLKLGYNATAATINRGIAEIVRISRKEKANPLTFLGLSGMGDLVLTCTGPLSRNRKLGVLLGEGKALAEITSQLGGVAEGYYTAQSAYELAKEFKIEMPITEEVYKILYQGNTPLKALQNLMARDLKEEW